MRRSRSLIAFVLGAALLLTPVLARADDARREDIVITKNSQFDRAHGVRSGRGTATDPYVISGWDVGNITISDTSKSVKIVNNMIRGTLTLNWIGERVTVRGNQIGDLRVNENVPRRGAPTSGTIARNDISQVGQLRHFDGRFVENVVGSSHKGTLGPLIGARAVNFDGFNGAEFARNTIYGYVDARLHGHHHSSGFDDDSHMHTSDSHDSHHGDMVDHTRRWHQVMIEDNTIYSSNSYALAYLDTNHADNDRTAASETDPELEDPHVHYTRAHIMNNTLKGGGILVDVFNASDDLHEKTARGSVHITGNKIALEPGSLYPFESRNGIEVREARNLSLTIARNTITAPKPKMSNQWLASLQSNGAGVQLWNIDRASVIVASTKVVNRQYGVLASQMTKTVSWKVTGLKTKGVQDPIMYDSSVKNAPKRS